MKLVKMVNRDISYDRDEDQFFYNLNFEIDMYKSWNFFFF